ncbi:MAG: M28 family peptidase [Planctomycetota bacterium]|nr:M28 family peptidase [Planctomycetota bacterium]
MNPRRSFLIWLTLLSTTLTAQAQRPQNLNAFRHIEILADDSFEGRRAGTEGGHAAAGYIVKHLSDFGLTPVGEESYFQPFNKTYDNCRNILATIPGSHPKLKNEIIAIGAHYDHIGYGKNKDRGPIHNGADDNASGTATLIELARFFSRPRNRPARTLMFCFWDSEEQGLIGSKYWMQNPTVDVERIVFKVNIDMIGRLDGETLEVQGHRSANNVKTQLDAANANLGIEIDYVFTMIPNSDHWPFINKGIPGFMFHTGLHKEYHKPEDDADTIDVEGLELVGKLARNFITHLSTTETPPTFRKESLTEKKPSNKD